MDTDLKPTTPKPASPAEPESQLPDLQDDPFKADDPQASGPIVVGKKHGGKGKVVLWVVLVLVLLAAVGGGVYYWQHQEVKKANQQVTELNNEVQALQDQVSKFEADAQDAEAEVEAEQTAATGDNAVIAAATAYCQAQVNPADSKALVFTAGTIGTAKKAVVYSTDKNFASLNATCGTTAAPGASQTYFLKNVNGNWVVVYRGATPDAAVTKLYTIPTAFN